jgi:hypothetical protein
MSQLTPTSEFQYNICRVVGHVFAKNGICDRCLFNEYIDLIQKDVIREFYGLKHTRNYPRRILERVRFMLLQLQLESKIHNFRNVNVQLNPLANTTHISFEVSNPYDLTYHYGEIVF